MESIKSLNKSLKSVDPCPIKLVRKTSSTSTKYSTASKVSTKTSSQNLTVSSSKTGSTCGTKTNGKLKNKTTTSIQSGICRRSNPNSTSSINKPIVCKSIDSKCTIQPAGRLSRKKLVNITRQGQKVQSSKCNRNDSSQVRLSMSDKQKLFNVVGFNFRPNSCNVNNRDKNRINKMLSVYPSPIYGLRSSTTKSKPLTLQNYKMFLDKKCKSLQELDRFDKLCARNCSQSLMNNSNFQSCKCDDCIKPVCQSEWTEKIKKNIMKNVMSKQEVSNSDCLNISQCGIMSPSYKELVRKAYRILNKAHSRITMNDCHSKLESSKSCCTLCKTCRKSNMKFPLGQSVSHINSTKKKERTFSMSDTHDWSSLKCNINKHADMLSKEGSIEKCSLRRYNRPSSSITTFGDNSMLSEHKLQNETFQEIQFQKPFNKYTEWCINQEQTLESCPEESTEDEISIRSNAFRPTALPTKLVLNQDDICKWSEISSSYSSTPSLMQNSRCKLESETSNMTRSSLSLTNTRYQW